jgi:hypothetical protein
LAADYLQALERYFQKIGGGKASVGKQETLLKDLLGRLDRLDLKRQSQRLPATALLAPKTQGE